MGGSVFTLYIGVVGAGVLSLPLTFYKSGWLLSLMIFIVGVILTYISCVLLVKASYKSQLNTYMQLAQHCSNKFFMYFIKVNYLINNWGYTLAFAVIINKLAAKTFKSILTDSSSVPSFLIDEKGIFWAALFILLVAFPLSIKKQLTGMSFLGLTSCFISIYTTIIIIYFSQNQKYNPNHHN